MDKQASREVRRRIRGILITDWDPVGVSDTPEAADEYDLYIGAVYELLERDASETDVSGYLRNIEVDRMGMIDGAGEPLMTEDKRKAAVSSLIELRRYFTKPSSTQRVPGPQSLTPNPELEAPAARPTLKLSP